MITIPATRARLTLLRLVHSNLPTAHIAAIQLIDRTLRSTIIGHLYETVPLATTRRPILDYTRA